MKKIILAVMSLVAFVAVASAQPRAVGVRVGGDAEVSYQHELGTNFLEADLGMSLLGNRGFYLSGTYDIIVSDSGTFNFYIGPGVQTGFYPQTNDNGKNDLGFSFGAALQFGIEYECDALPFNFSLDWRPAYNFVGSGNFNWTGIALGIRHRFSQRRYYRY